MGSGAWLRRHVPRHQCRENRWRRYPKPLVDRQAPRRRTYVKFGCRGLGRFATARPLYAKRTQHVRHLNEASLPGNHQRRSLSTGRLIYLAGSFAVIAKRMTDRTGHFMPPALFGKPVFDARGTPRWRKMQSVSISTNPSTTSSSRRLNCSGIENRATLGRPSDTFWPQANSGFWHPLFMPRPHTGRVSEGKHLGSSS